MNTNEINFGQVINENFSPPDAPELLIPLNEEELGAVADRLNALQGMDFALAVHTTSAHDETVAEPICKISGNTIVRETEQDVLLWRNFRPVFDESFVDQVADTFSYTLLTSRTLTFEQHPHLASRIAGDIELEATTGCKTESGSATGAVVWDSSLVVARFLEIENNDNTSLYQVKSKTCFELGSGCGLLASVLWHLGAVVTASERPELIPLLEQNMRANCQNPQQTTASYHISEHMWGDPLSQDKLPDFVFAVDCVYDEDAVNQLVKSLLQLSNHAQTTILVAVDTSYNRSAALTLFMELIDQNNLESSEVGFKELQESRPESVKLWKVHRKST